MQRRFSYTRKSPRPRQPKAAGNYAVQINMWSGVGAGVLMMMLAAATVVK